MRSIVNASVRRRLWLASTVLIPLSPFAIPAAHAQQSASPDLLPPVEVSPSKKPEAVQPPTPQKPNNATGRCQAEPAEAGRKAGDAAAGYAKYGRPAWSVRPVS